MYDNRTVVQILYNALLGREPDPQGFATYLEALDNQQYSPEQLASALMKSAEFMQRKRLLGDELLGFSDQRVYAGYSLDDLAVFSIFSQHQPKPRPGFVTDFIGSKVRTSFLWNGCEHLDGAVLPTPIPWDYHAEAIEWIGLLKAVLAAQESFAGMEIGAGYGPWIAAGAAAARLRGIERVAFCGVEADPGRFANLRQNVEDNNLQGAEVELIEGAIGIYDGWVYWPKLVDSRNDAGARPLRQGNRDDEMYLGNRYQEMLDVKVIAFEPLITSRKLWDFIHIDVQGTEGELCTACLPALSEHVRYLIVATHSRKLDGDMMELMLNGGWQLENEKPARMSWAPGRQSLIEMVTADGTQVWRNPRW
jgi:FkbM family methyltransferase